MSGRGVSAYQRLPYPAKVAVATARGMQLRWWRYGRDAEELVADALAADRRPVERLLADQDERLARMLHTAARDVPYYRRQWDERRRAGDRSPVDDLASWPVLDKAEVKADPRAFVAEPNRPEHMFEEHTSGTTGTPLTLWWTRPVARRWYALFEARSRRWHGVDRRRRWAILGGQPVVAPDRGEPPFWVWNPALHQLYLSGYHVGPATAEAYGEALSRHRVTHVLGYPSALAALGGWLHRAGAVPAGIQVVLTNAESLLPHQREAIARGFGAPVRDTFGQAEIVAAGSECEHGTMHLWPEVGRIEVLDPHGLPVGDGTSGRLVATGLLNDGMPLIRYDTGDALVRPPAGLPDCACGRSLPRLGEVQGRADDVVITPDGRHLGRLDPVFKADLPIVEAQVIQERLDLVRVLVVPLPAFDATAEAGLTQRLHDVLGDVRVEIDRVDAVPRGANGKFRAVISHVPRPDSSEVTG